MDEGGGPSFLENSVRKISWTFKCFYQLLVFNLISKTNQVTGCVNFILWYSGINIIFLADLRLFDQLLIPRIQSVTNQQMIWFKCKRKSLQFLDKPICFMCSTDCFTIEISFDLGKMRYFRVLEDSWKRNKP